jgi:hypothetical protein
MKKALLYVATAILLGTVTMVASLMLFKPRYYELITSRDENVTKLTPALIEAIGEGEFPATPDEGVKTFGEGGALERAVGSSNLSSAALMLIPSFLLALGISLYFKKRIRERVLG